MISETPILQDISQIQHQHQVVFCVYWDRIRVCQFNGFVRNRQLYPIEAPKLKAYRLK